MTQVRLRFFGGLVKFHDTALEVVHAT